MEMITHCGARPVLALLQKCHDVCIIHFSTSQHPSVPLFHLYYCIYIF